MDGVKIYNILDYFKCPDIRSKIYHPFFLFFKFSNMIDLYVNKDILKNKSQTTDVNEFIKEILYQIYAVLEPLNNMNESKFI